MELGLQAGPQNPTWSTMVPRQCHKWMALGRVLGLADRPCNPEAWEHRAAFVQNLENSCTFLWCCPLCLAAFFLFHKGDLSLQPQCVCDQAGQTSTLSICDLEAPTSLPSSGDSSPNKASSAEWREGEESSTSLNRFVLSINYFLVTNSFLVSNSVLPIFF